MTWRYVCRRWRQIKRETPVPKRILLVEDVPSLLAAVGLALRNLGYSVVGTDSGMDALTLLRSKPPPDLLILDLVMPGVDGYQVLKALGPTSPPVILITGTDDNELLNVLTPPVMRVLHKPFEHHQLAEAVGSVLQGSSADIPILPSKGTTV